MEEIKSTIDANITPNGEQGITGSVLNRVLNDMVDATEGKLAQLDQEIEEIKNADFTLNPHIEMVEPTETILAIEPDKFYKWGAVSSLYLTFVAPNKGTAGAYLFQFTSPADNATSLSLPVDIEWEKQPNIEGGKTYQVSVLEKLAVLLEWKN